MACVNDCLLLKKSIHGSERLRRAAKFPRLNSAGSSEVRTSDHASGVEIGA